MMKINTLLARPKGTPLIVCACTSPRPWPLFVQHAWRFYEAEPDHASPTRTLGFVEVEWYVRNLRGHCHSQAAVTGSAGAQALSASAGPSSASDTCPASEAEDKKVLLYNHLSGSCPQCDGKFEVRFKTPVSQPNALLVEAAHSHDYFAYETPQAQRERGREAAHEFVQIVGRRNKVYFERTAYRMWKERIYWPSELEEKRNEASPYLASAAVLSRKKKEVLLKTAHFGGLWSNQFREEGARDFNEPSGDLHKTLLQMRLPEEQTVVRPGVEVDHAEVSVGEF